MLELPGSFSIGSNAGGLFLKLEPLELLTLALVIFTALYSFVTLGVMIAQKMVIKEMRKARDLSILPKLKMNYELIRDEEDKTVKFPIKLKNIGRGPALNIKFEVQDDVTNQLANFGGMVVEGNHRYGPLDLEPGEEGYYLLYFQEGLQSKAILRIYGRHEDLLGNIKERSWKAVFGE